MKVLYFWILFGASVQILNALFSTIIHHYIAYRLEEKERKKRGGMCAAAGIALTYTLHSRTVKVMARNFLLFSGLPKYLSFIYRTLSYAVHVARCARLSAAALYQCGTAQVSRRKAQHNVKSKDVI
jgi:hypothetical protein